MVRFDTYTVAAFSNYHHHTLLWSGFCVHLIARIIENRARDNLRNFFFFFLSCDELFFCPFRHFSDSFHQKNVVISLLIRIYNRAYHNFLNESQFRFRRIVIFHANYRKIEKLKWLRRNIVLISKWLELNHDNWINWIFPLENCRKKMLERKDWLECSVARLAKTKIEDHIFSESMQIQFFLIRPHLGWFMGELCERREFQWILRIMKIKLTVFIDEIEHFFPRIFVHTIDPMDDFNHVLMPIGITYA